VAEPNSKILADKKCIATIVLTSSNKKTNTRAKLLNYIFTLNATKMPELRSQIINSLQNRTNKKHSNLAKANIVSYPQTTAINTVHITLFIPASIIEVGMFSYILQT
jgi:hypothetical protein